MPDQILLGGHQFTAVKTLDLTRDASAPKHPLESGSDVSDHVSLNPATFEIELELMRDPDEYATLESLYVARQPIRLVTPHGVFDNVVLLKLSDQYGMTINTTKATISLQQVLIVETQTVTISSGLTDAKALAEEQFPGGYTVRTLALIPIDKTDLATPAENETWKDTMNLWAKSDNGTLGFDGRFYDALAM